MENGQGKVQAAILFCYTVAMKPDAKKSYVADEGDSPASLRCVVRLFEYDGGVNNCCRQAMVTVCVFSNVSSPHITLLGTGTGLEVVDVPSSRSGVIALAWSESYAN